VIRGFWVFVAFLSPLFSYAGEDFWKDVGLTFTDMKAFYSQAECTKEEKKVQACVSAARRLVESTNDPQNEPNSLVTLQVKDAKLNQEPSRVLAEFGPLQIVVIKVQVTKGMKPAQINAKRKAAKLAQQEALADIFRRGQAGSIQFEALLDWARENKAKSVQEHFLVAGAMNTFLNTYYDPHTYARPTAEVQKEMSSNGENFAGIGAELSPFNNQILVARVIENSPALRGGLRPKDVITHIKGNEGEDFEPTTRLTLDAAVKKIRGHEGKKVTLRVQRGEQILDLEFERQNISSANVEYKFLSDGKVPVGLIRLDSFSSLQSCGDIARGIDQAMKDQAKGLILDLRNNGGGSLGQAQCIASLFLPAKKTVVSVRDVESGNILDVLYPQPLVIPTPNGWAVLTHEVKLPTAILINARSASASEIISGAFQDHGRAIIIGERSFGKGTVQTPLKKPLIALRPEVQSKLTFYKTTERFHLPSGRTNQIVGVVPDIEVFPNPQPTEEQKFAMREEDQYLNPISAINTPWQHPFPKEIEQINGCVSSSGRALEEYERRKDDQIPGDLQLLTAQDALACIVGPEASPLAAYPGR
jgi:carboxyl-terminal processing protease